MNIDINEKTYDQFQRLTILKLITKETYSGVLEQVSLHFAKIFECFRIIYQIMRI